MNQIVLESINLIRGFGQLVQEYGLNLIILCGIIGGGLFIKLYFCPKDRTMLLIILGLSIFINIPHVLTRQIFWGDVPGMIGSYFLWAIGVHIAFSTLFPNVMKRFSRENILYKKLAIKFRKTALKKKD